METQPTPAEQVLAFVSLALVLTFIVGSVATWMSIRRRIAENRSALPYEPRTRVPWRGIDVVVIAVFYIGVQGLSVIAAMRIAGIDPGSVDVGTAMHTPEILLALSLANLGAAAFVIVWLRLVRAVSATELGWGPGRLGTDISIGLLGLLAVAPPVYVLQGTLSYFFPVSHPIINSLQRDGGSLMFAVATFAVVVAAPVVEELLFRLVLQGWLEACEPRWRRLVPQLVRWPRGCLPIVISSTVFAAMHIGAGPAPIPLFLLALVLGYLYQRTHRILPSIVMHAGFNATSMVMLGLQLASSSGAGS